MKRIVIFLCCACALPAQAEPLGRLFYTPEQRAALDLARKTTPLNTSGEPDANSPPGLMLNGIVTRSDGKRSTWINGRLEQDSAHPGMHDRNQARVPIPGGSVKLKVGQSLDPATGRVEEGYQRTPPPAPPEPAAVKPAPPKAPTKATSETRDDSTEPEPPAAQ